MTGVKFDKKLVQRGDMLALKKDMARRMLFKFIGHDGAVVATWLEQVEGRPADVILRQRDVVRLVSC